MDESVLCTNWTAGTNQADQKSLDESNTSRYNVESCFLFRSQPCCSRMARSESTCFPRTAACNHQKLNSTYHTVLRPSRPMLHMASWAPTCCFMARRYTPTVRAMLSVRVIGAHPNTLRTTLPLQTSNVSCALGMAKDRSYIGPVNGPPNKLVVVTVFVCCEPHFAECLSHCLASGLCMVPVMCILCNKSPNYHSNVNTICTHHVTPFILKHTTHDKPISPSRQSDTLDSRNHGGGAAFVLSSLVRPSARHDVVRSTQYTTMLAATWCWWAGQEYA